MSATSFLNRFLETFCPDNSALVTNEGEILHLQSSSPLSYGTLGVAAQTVMKYLPLRVGDVALLNDPYSGGSTLNEFTFVTKILDNAPSSVWFVLRRAHGKPLISNKTIEEEGLRIPPTPIYQSKNMNQMILGAMSAHPMCPPDFAQWLEKNCREIEALVKKFSEVQLKHKISFSKNALKDYLEASRNVAKEKISEASSGEARVEVLMDNNEMIRLHLEIHEGQVTMDFSGTSPSKTMLLTESATYGTCLHSLAQFYDFGSLRNTGAFSILQVSKPSGCLLSAKYPAPLSAGAVSVLATLQTVVALALSHIHTKRKKSLSAYCPLEIELKNAMGQVAVLRLPGGAGSTAEGGRPFFLAMNEKLSEKLSVENLERNWPVRILRFDYREPSAKSEALAGRGLCMRIEATADLDIQWRTDLTLHKWKLPKHLTAGIPAEVNLLQGDKGHTQKPVGQIQMRAGEILAVASGIGGV